MDNLTFQRIKDLVNANQNIGVIVGPNPTLDTMAAGLGMYLALSKMGKAVSVACPTDVNVGLSSLVGIDKVVKALGGVGGDMTVSFPYQDGEIDKVSYTLENNLLNIVVKAGQKGLSFSQNDVQFKRSGAVPQLLFLIGVTNPQDIVSLAQESDLKSATVVNIDNNQGNSGYGEVAVISAKASSHSEQVADFLTLLEPQIELDVDTSQNLLSGIIFATDDFKNPKTSYLALEMAGILMKKGAVRKTNIGGGQTLPGNLKSQDFFPPASNPSKVLGQSMAETQVLQEPVQEKSKTDFIPPEKPVETPKTEEKPVQIEQQTAQKPAPSDWLTPKVYKGSTIL